MCLLACALPLPQPLRRCRPPLAAGRCRRHRAPPPCTSRSPRSFRTSPTSRRSRSRWARWASRSRRGARRRGRVRRMPHALAPTPSPPAGPSCCYQTRSSRVRLSRAGPICLLTRVHPAPCPRLTRAFPVHGSVLSLGAQGARVRAQGEGEADPLQLAPALARLPGGNALQLVQHESRRLRRCAPSPGARGLDWQIDLVSQHARPTCLPLCSILTHSRCAPPPTPHAAIQHQRRGLRAAT